MSEQHYAAKKIAIKDPADLYPVRPVGTWIVAGFLVFSIVVIWALVAIVFSSRS